MQLESFILCLKIFSRNLKKPRKKLKALQQNLDLETLEKEEEGRTQCVFIRCQNPLEKKDTRQQRCCPNKVTDAMQMLSMAGGCFEAKLNSS